MSKRALVLAVVALATSVSASATIISGVVTGGSAFTAGGVFVKLPVPIPNPFGPPDSVGNDNFQTQTCSGSTRTRIYC